MAWAFLVFVGFILCVWEGAHYTELRGQHYLSIALGAWFSTALNTVWLLSPVQNVAIGVSAWRNLAGWWTTDILQRSKRLHKVKGSGEWGSDHRIQLQYREWGNDPTMSNLTIYSWKFEAMQFSDCSVYCGTAHLQKASQEARTLILQDQRLLP